MTLQHNLLISVSGFCFGLALSACHGSEKNPNHCLYNQGNQTCAEYDWPDGIERPYCTNVCHPLVDEYNGCVAEEPTDLECYSPCGNEKSAIEDDSCLGTADESTDSDSETSADTTTETETGPGPCMSDEDCLDAAAPFCGDQGECVSCTDTPDPDAACAGLDGGATPVCEAGSCVQCTTDNTAACMGLTPVCDEGTSACVGCDWHEQCDDACHMKEGSCFPNNVFRAGPPMTLGYFTLPLALAEIDMLDPKVGVVEMYDHAAGVDFLESIVVPSGMTVAFVMAPENGMPQWPNGTPTWQGQDAPALTVAEGAVVYIQGIRIANGTAEGIVVDGGELWVDRSQVVNNDGGGIEVNGGGSLVLRNSFVGGGTLVNDNAIHMTDGDFQIAYSTLGGGALNSSPLACDMNASGSNIHNSLLVSYTSNVACDGVNIMSSVLEDISNYPGNIELMFDDQSMWFVGYDQGDFHLIGANAPAAIANAASWQSGDPLVDIDGDPRPVTGGADDYAGADRIP
ncbi:hypothetical protein ACNOYE_07920 [Nannocystaceae bacterium ST9]